MTEPPVYFAFTDGRQIGPIRFAELADLVARGVLLSDDLVWQSGTPEWVAASSVIAFPKRALDETHGFGDDTFSSRTATRTRMTTRSGTALALRVASGQHAAPAPTPEAAPPAPAPAPVLRPGEMISFARLLDPETFGSPVSWILVIFGLAPLVFSLVVEDPALKLQLFAFICGAAWTAFFVSAFRTSEDSPPWGVGIFFGSAAAGAALLALLHEVPPLAAAFHAAGSGGALPFRVLAAILTVAFLEEGVKVAFVLVVARLSVGISSPRAGTFYGLMSGVGFGIWESVSQAGALAAEGAGADVSTAALSATFAGRALQAFTVPLLHALWTGIAGYFVGLGPRSGRDPRFVIGVGFVLVVLLHGLTEAVAAAGWGFTAVVAAAFSLLLFLACQRNADRLDEVPR